MAGGCNLADGGGLRGAVRHDRSHPQHRVITRPTLPKRCAPKSTTADREGALSVGRVAQAKVRGLLGNANGNTDENDLAGRDWTVLRRRSPLPRSLPGARR